MEPGFDHYKALQARDARFDGLFYVGVKTTGVYCRPVCPARTPRARSCVFLDTAAAAEQAGFRPCLRCRPELAPGTGGNGAPSLEHALLAAVRARVAHGASAAELSGVTGFSARQLRRLFGRAFGVTPVEVVQTERLLFAKKLLQETGLPMTDVAFGAGFRSLRRFNALFRARYGLAPTALRRTGTPPRRAGNGFAMLPADALTLRLAYRPPLAWREFLTYLVRRAVPGVEWADASRGVYGRTVSLNGRTGWVLVRRSARGEALDVHVPPVLADVLWPLLARLRGVFDLDANPAWIDAALGADPFLAPSVSEHPGLRVPGGWDAFELAVRAVLGQQISVAGATTIAGRLAACFGQPVETPFASLTRLAPTPQILAAADVEEIAAIGMPRTRAGTLRDLAAAALRGELDFRPGTDIAAATEALGRVRGIGPWTAQYVAMRALRFPDAFPSADLGLRKALTPPGQTALISEKALLARAEAWRPWRAYAAVRLWQSLEKSSPLAPTTMNPSASYYTEIPSPLGTLGLRATARGLIGLYMEEHRHGPGPAERAGWIRDDAPFAQARRELEEYFAGSRTAFDVPLDQEGIGGSAFQQKVWAALLKIPYGETITYGELARRIGQPAAVRAVGLANGRNPVSLIVPCHRVIGSGGKLTGYGGGMDRKGILLALESRGCGGNLLL